MTRLIDPSLHKLSFIMSQMGDMVIESISLAIDSYLTGTNTKDNVQGKIPEFMKQIGFQDVIESERIFSIFGIISFYKGIK